MEDINELIEVYKVLNDFLFYLEREKNSTIKEIEEKGGTISSE